jgi:transcription initiation factor TFIIIB Brf1 subunit/transcription initiation factor TFIIB
MGKETDDHLQSITECPDCASQNIVHSATRDQVICKECGLVFEPFTPVEAPAAAVRPVVAKKAKPAKKAKAKKPARKAKPKRAKAKPKPKKARKAKPKKAKARKARAKPAKKAKKKPAKKKWGWW